MPMNAPENVLPMEASGRVVGRDDRRIGRILAEEGRLGVGDIEQVMELQRMEGLRFGEAALRLGLITADQLHHAIAKQYDLPHLLPGSESIGSELVVALEPFHPRAEELRALRTQLLIRWSNAKVEHPMLAIVSPASGEGRSYVAANLAVAFSQLGERTLLIDADLRSPRQHLIFNVSDRIGLAAVLSGRADRSAVAPVPEFGPFWLLPAGARPPNPQELLSRLALAVLLHELRNEFDVILIDTPPAKLYADAQAVAFRAGSAMVLARKDRTHLEDTKRVIRELGDMGARIVGTVFNAF
jgi:chain length determinant protein tyrosine kinase EpsG